MYPKTLKIGNQGGTIVFRTAKTILLIILQDSRKY